MRLSGELDVGHRPGALLFPAQQGSGEALAHAAVPQHPDAQGVGVFGQCRCARIIGAHHQGATGGDAVDECGEHLGVRLLAPEEIQVIGLDVGDHRDIRGVLQQRAVTLVGLGDKAGTAAVMGVGARFAQFATHGERGVEPAVLQCHDEHRRGGGLAVRARHHQRGVTGHELGQHHRPQDHRDSPAPRLDQLRIGLRDRGVRGDHGGRAAGQQVQRRRVVPDPDLGATCPQRHHAARLLGIRTGHQAATVQQDAGHSRHPGSPDTDHVHPLQLSRK